MYAIEKEKKMIYKKFLSRNSIKKRFGALKASAAKSSAAAKLFQSHAPPVFRLQNFDSAWQVRSK